MKNYWIAIGGIFGFSGVALGAFGAHQFKNSLTPEMMEIFKTGVFYHLVHSAVILAVGFYSNSRFFKAAIFFSAGIILFSFTLYIYSVTSIKTFAMITPLGGISFLIGWLLVIISGISLSKNKS